MGMLCCIYGVRDEELTCLRDNAEALDDFLEGSEDVSDLDKAWHGIHFLLTGSAWDGEPPLNFLICGGTPLEDFDQGVGPDRYLDPGEVVDIHVALEAITTAELRKKFDSRKFVAADIYPEIWHRADEESQNLEYLIKGYERMKEHLAMLVDGKKGAIVSIR